MSVFSDFQRMWVQRFPQSSLSDAWEQDVRASLARHKQKITELTKDVEQETLYVEYLERLLGDVEKYRDAGGDPSTLFEANTTAAVMGKDEDKEKDGAVEENQIIKAAAAAHHDKGTNGTAADDDGPVDSTKDPIALRRDAHHKDSALNQCINELTSNLHQRRCVSSSDVPAPTSPTSKSSTSSPTSTMTSGAGGQVANSSSQPDSESEQSSSRSRRSSQSEALLSSPSHFVTVIEVKESSEKAPQEQDQQPSATKRNSVAPALPAKSSSVTSGDNCNNNNTSSPAAAAPLPVANPRPNSYENVLINTNRGSCENLNNNSVVHGGHVIHQQNNNNSEHSTFLDNNGGGGQGVAKYPKPSAPPMTMGSSIADRTSQLIGSGGGAQDLKKKVPPR